MEMRSWLLAAVFVVGLVALVGFFKTKESGFGPYNTSTLVLLVVVIVSGFLYAADCVSGQVLANIFFVAVGFAGGLFTREPISRSTTSSG